MTDANHVLFIDDEAPIRMAAQQTLELADVAVICHETAAATLPTITADFPGVVVCDVKLPGVDGLALLAKVREIDPDLPIILVTGHGDIAMTVNAIRGGAYDFGEKPYAPETLTEVVRRGLDKRAGAGKPHSAPGTQDAEQSGPADYRQRARNKRATHHHPPIGRRQIQKTGPPLSTHQQPQLLSHDWPGNVRELQNTAERYILPGEQQASNMERLMREDKEEGGDSLRHLVENFERSLIEQELKACRGNITQATRTLDIPRTMLHDKIRKYELDFDRFRAGSL